MAYALWVDRITADVRNQQQTATFASVLGGKPAWPTLDDRLAAFEEALASEPPRVDSEQAQLRAALGLRSGRG